MASQFRKSKMPTRHHECAPGNKRLTTPFAGLAVPVVGMITVKMPAVTSESRAFNESVADRAKKLRKTHPRPEDGRRSANWLVWGICERQPDPAWLFPEWQPMNPLGWRLA